MAGSGRGRGHASSAFNMEAIGFSKDAALPDVITIISNRRRLPGEMKPKKANKKGAKTKKAKNSEPKSNLDVNEKKLKKKDEEKEKPEDEKDKEGEDDEEAEEPEEYDEEEHKEENDYVSSHFEDGDGFDVVSDDNMVEAT